MAQEKKIIFTYTVNVYDDGSAEIVPVTAVTDGAQEKLDSPATAKVGTHDVSAKIRQITDVLVYVQEHYHEKIESQTHVDYLLAMKLTLKDAISQVSDSYGISKQSVSDKLCRQLGKSMNEWPALLKSCFLDRNYDELMQLLLSNIATGYEIGDSNEIHAFFERLSGSDSDN